MEIKQFQDYVFYHICRTAAELNIPIQCHTGLGCLNGTNAVQMREVIEANPATTFVLFHAGFPWVDDILGVAHKCHNVIVDICWLPSISISEAISTLHKLIEVIPINRICWGCDTWSSEGSYGARLEINHVLATVLSEKIRDDYLDLSDAKIIIKSLLYDNPKQVYGI